jgi:DNA-binding HxlR family transcriptional regulator
MRKKSISPMMDESKALEGKGGLHIVTILGSDGPQRYTDLDKKIPVSDSTLSQRLRVGRGQFWEESLRRLEDGSTARVWELTEEGREIYELAKEHEILDTAVEVRQKKLEYDEAKQLLLDEIEVTL